MISRRDVLLGGGALAGTAAMPSIGQADNIPLRVAQLKFGSVSWLLQTVFDEGLDKKAGLNLKISDVATNSAAQIGLMSGTFDLIVSDWPWAMVQRSRGLPMRFAPYSSSLGALVVSQDSNISNLADLEGKRIAVAGSAIDKSWLLLRAYAARTLNKDLAEVATPIFGAPPLVQRQLMTGRADAALNFWTFAAKLSGTGYRQILTMADVLLGLDITPSPPLVGFIWNEEKTRDKAATVESFINVVNQANGLLATTDMPWDRVRPKMRVDQDGEFEALKAFYRSGIPAGWSQKETASAEKLLALLAELGDKGLSGQKTKFHADLFYGA